MSEEKEGQPHSVDFDLSADYAFDQIGKNASSVPIQAHPSGATNSPHSPKTHSKDSDAVKQKPCQPKQVDIAQDLPQENSARQAGASLSRLQQVRSKKEYEKNRLEVALPDDDRQYHAAHFLLYGVCIFLFLTDFIFSGERGGYLKGAYFLFWNLLWLFLGGISLEKISHMVLSRQGMTRAEGYYVFGWGAGIFMMLYVLIYLMQGSLFVMGNGYRLLLVFVLGWVSLITAMRFRGGYDWLPSVVVSASCTLWMMLLDAVGMELGNTIFPSRF